MSNNKTLLTAVLILPIIASNSFAIGSKSSSSKKRNVTNVIVNQATVSTDADLDCMDSYCISPAAPEKGKCRCSGTISKYNSINQSITEIENEIAERNRITSLTNSNVEVDKILTKTEDIYTSLKQTEDVNGINGTLRSLEEGSTLLDMAAEKCEISDADIIDDYKFEVELDCEKYSAHLNDKLELANSLLSTAIKNQELAEENKFKQTNQLSNSLCKSEYKNCIKTDCGNGFLKCPNSILVNKAIKSCEEKLYGKCENSKKIIIEEVKKEIPQDRAKERKRQKKIEDQNKKNRGKDKKSSR